MLIELDKEALVSLAAGEQPYYSIFEDPIIKKCGSHRGGIDGDWVWDYDELRKLSEQELYGLYLFCRLSWKKENPKVDD